MIIINPPLKGKDSQTPGGNNNSLIRELTRSMHECAKVKQNIAEYVRCSL